MKGAPTFLYFAERGGLIKIGISVDVLNRLRTLRADLLGAVAGTWADEAELHRRFAEFSVGHEWYVDCEPIRTHIATVPPFISDWPRPPLPESEPYALLTIPEAAELLRIHPRSAYRLAREGKFPVPVLRHLGPRELRVSRTLLDRYMATGVPIESVPA